MLPSTKQKLRNFPSKTEARRNRTFACCLQRSTGPQSWLELHLSFAYLRCLLDYTLELSLAFATSWPKLEMKKPLWSPVRSLNLFFSYCSDQGWSWSTDTWVQFPWNAGYSAAGFLSESVCSSAPRERRINTRGQETADAKNYRL